MKELFKEIREDCPFALAEYLDISLYGVPELDGVGGCYMVHAGLAKIILNSSIQSEIQDKACYELVKHHLTHCGLPKVLTVNELKSAEKGRANIRSSIFSLAKSINM